MTFFQVMFEEILKAAKTDKSFEPKAICQRATKRHPIRINSPGSTYRLPAIAFRYLQLLNNKTVDKWLEITRMKEYASTVYWDENSADKISLDFWFQKRSIDEAYFAATGIAGPYNHTQLCKVRMSRSYMGTTIRYLNKFSPAISLWKEIVKELNLNELVNHKNKYEKRVKVKFCPRNIVPLSWQGSKRRIAFQILDNLKLEDKFCDVFTGSGVISMIVRKICPEVKVWMNDADLLVYSFHKTVRDDVCYLINKIQSQPPKESLWKEYKKILKLVKASDNFPTNELAWMFYYVQVYSYGQLGKYFQPEFHCKDELKYSKLENCSELLQGVKITNEDFRKVLKIAKGTVYADPPYYELLNRTKDYIYYNVYFNHQDHLDLSVMLKNYKKPWLLSYDDNPVVKEYYEDCEISKVKVSRSMGGANSRKTQELFIKNAPSEKIEPTLHDVRATEALVKELNMKPAELLTKLERINKIMDTKIISQCLNYLVERV